MGKTENNILLLCVDNIQPQSMGKLLRVDEKCDKVTLFVGETFTKKKDKEWVYKKYEGKNRGFNEWERWC